MRHGFRAYLGITLILFLCYCRPLFPQEDPAGEETSGAAEIEALADPSATEMPKADSGEYAVPQGPDYDTVVLEGLTSQEVSASGMPEFKKVIRLTEKEAVGFAMKHNPDLKNARRDLEMAELDIKRSMASYDPYLRADASYSRSKKPTSQAAFGETSETGSVTLGTGVNTITGGNLSLDFRNTRQESDSMFSTLNPSYSTDLILNIRQPLLKNRYDNSRALNLQMSNNDYQRALLSLKSKELEIESSVEDAYWSLFSALQNLEQKKRSLELARRMHEMTKAQIEAGTAPPVSTQQTKANVASARASLIRSENDYRSSQNSFKMTLNLMSEDLFEIEIVPADLPDYEPPQFDRQEFVAESMANNFSLRQTRLNIANSRINLYQSENRALPQLDFNASVGVSGLAGHSNPSDQMVETGFVVPNPLPSDQFPQPYIVERVMVPGQPSEYEGGYEDALDDMFEGDNLSWSAGVSYQMPVGNRAAEAELSRSKLSYEKQIEDFQHQQRQVYLNLVNMLYEVEAAHRNLVAASDARRLQEQNLSTEEKKYSLGLNTSYEVLQAEESFQESRSAELSAFIEYTKALGRMERAKQGYLQTGGVTSMPVSVSAGMPSGGAMPSGVDASMLEQYSGMLPGGMDIKALESYMP
ncbi:MAG: TolC family protein [bacterium]